MVVPVLVGRFANQGFQIACAVAYAKKHGLEYHIPKHTANDSIWPPAFDNLENPNYNEKLPAIRIEEKTHAYHEIEFKEEWRNYNIFLSGYWQSYKYFDWCIDDVRDILKQKGPSKKPTKWTVGIHVRRGDYLLYPDKHPVITKGYIKSAVEKIEWLIGVRYKKEFDFFSDDVDWCKKISIGIKDEDISWGKNRVIYVQNKNDTDDFYQLMNCGHQIVANSSFSVLAAILNPNPNKIVVCPHEDNYFGINNKHLDVSTLYPENWHRIKY